MKKNKLKRLVIDLGYVIKDGDDQMEQHAKEAFYEDIMSAYKYDDLWNQISVIDAPDATEKDIPEFLLEDDSEDWLKD